MYLRSVGWDDRRALTIGHATRLVTPGIPVDPISSGEPSVQRSHTDQSEHDDPHPERQRDQRTLPSDEHDRHRHQHEERKDLDEDPGIGSREQELSHDIVTR